jgi:hypothetical protein
MWRVPVSESGSRVGFVDPDSIDLAGDWGVGVPARRGVLGWRAVTQRRVTVSLVVFLLEVADHHAGGALQHVSVDVRCPVSLQLAVFASYLAVFGVSPFSQ